MFGVLDPRRSTVANLPSDVKAAADYILEETGDATAKYKVVKAPEATVAVNGHVQFTLSVALAAGDHFTVGGHVITGYAGDPGADTYGINVSTANTVALQVTAIKALSFADFNITGDTDTVILTQKVFNVGVVTAPVVTGLAVGRLTEVESVEPKAAEPTLLNSYTNDPYRFAEKRLKVVVVSYDGAVERVDSLLGRE